jgi:hypothetical protein
MIIHILIALFLYDIAKFAVNIITIYTAKKYPKFMYWLFKKKITTLFLFLSTVLLAPFICHAQDTTWKHVYHLDRFTITTPDTTITGKVVKVLNEIDGDRHIVLESGLEVEIICQCRITVPDAATACEGYGQRFPKPKPGQVITVTGPYVFDNHHAHYEVHPVKTMVIQ